jgi:hypothetical protein
MANGDVVEFRFGSTSTSKKLMLVSAETALKTRRRNEGWDTLWL